MPYENVGNTRVFANSQDLDVTNGLIYTMTISDILTIIGILLAIFAFISEKSREFVFLKFSFIQKILLVIIFFLVHFLISFDWWRAKFSCLNNFEFDGFPLPPTWAYIISLITLIWAVWKIFKSNFPLSNLKKLMAYYENLLMRGEFAILSELIEQYHLESVTEFLVAKRSLIAGNQTRIWVENHDEYVEAYRKTINSASKIYGESVFNQIFLNDIFIENVANYKPLLFARVIQELNTESVKEDRFVNRYLKIITLNKNGMFFREIRNNQKLSKFDGYEIEKSRLILFSFFNDIRVASINQAWRGVAEQAIIEMEEEVKKIYSPLREIDREQEHDTVWGFRITIAISYFDIMVREAIKQNIDDHMFMYYYRRFVESILRNMDDLPSRDSSQNGSTRNYYLIYNIFSNMTEWKGVATKSKNYGLIDCAFDCIGQCLFELTNSDKINDDNKLIVMNMVWEDLIKTCPEEDNDIERENIDAIISRGFEMFKRPTMLFATDDEEKSSAYLIALRNLWIRRDIPMLNGLLQERASKFEREVIEVLITNE